MSKDFSAAHRGRHHVGTAANNSKGITASPAHHTQHGPHNVAKSVHSGPHHTAGAVHHFQGIKAAGSSHTFGAQVFNFLWGMTAAQLVITLIKKAKECAAESHESKSLEELIEEKERLEDLIAQAAAEESTE